jgi:hypothetical protein
LFSDKPRRRKVLASSIHLGCSARKSNKYPKTQATNFQ